MGPSMPSVARWVARSSAAACLAVPLLTSAVPAAGRPATQTAPVWPSPDLVAQISSLLVGLYDQEASPDDPYYYLAPEWEADKWRAAKDPDSLWEIVAPSGAACHEATSQGELVDCAGHRLATAVGAPYAGGLALFDPAVGFEVNAWRVKVAASLALYHAFVHDFDAPHEGPYDASSARDAKLYHARMIQAYEAHMRHILVGMFADTRNDAAFQLNLTLGLGRLAVDYVRTVQAVEEYAAWSAPTDRRDALALVNGMNQRLWWEWAWTQSEGPRTAGFVDLGSEATQQAAAAAAPRWEGTDRFEIDGRAVPSLRPAASDQGAFDGFWVDADYAIPGEWWCYARYRQYSTSLDACLAQARGAAAGGAHSPFGQYYGPAGGPAACPDRAGNVTTTSCGTGNRGSIAPDWTEAFLGARMGMTIMRGLAASGDPDLPDGAVGPDEIATVTDRLGFGIAGWHGGRLQQDDMEWTWGSTMPVVAIRTLSAARHDVEPQDDRFSLGETDSSAVSVARNGDTWRTNGQEYPGALERHSPGPNPYYGSRLFATVLSDRTSEGLAGSLYDARFRDEPDEFNTWVWLMLGTFYRCTDVADPADGSCLAATAADWPFPPEIHRLPLFVPPTDPAMDLRFRYLWRNPETTSGRAISDGSIAERDTTCRGGGGLPWQHVNDWAVLANSGYLIDEGGRSAYYDLVAGYGGLMRLIAARYPLEPTDAALADDYAEQRDGLLAPWYHEMARQLGALLELYRQPPPLGYGYVPDVENSTCVGYNPYTPSDPANKIMLPWQVGTADTIEQTAAHRATGYGALAEWYWWYTESWLDVDQTAW